MAESRRRTTVDGIDAKRRALKKLCELMGLLREAVRERMEDEGTNHVLLARNTEVKSPQAMQAFLEGRGVICHGKRLQSLADYAEFPPEYTKEILDTTTTYGDSVVAVVAYGESAVDLFCDIERASIDAGNGLTVDDFSDLFGESAKLVKNILNRRWTSLEPFRFHEADEDSGGQLRHVLRVLDINDAPEIQRILECLADTESLAATVAERIRQREEEYQELLTRWQKVSVKIGATQQQIADKLGGGKSSISMALSPKNPFRISSLRGILSRAERYLKDPAAYVKGSPEPSAQADESDVAGAPLGESLPVADDASQEPGDAPQAKEHAGSNGSGPLRRPSRLTRADIRSLVIEDWRELVRHAQFLVQQLIVVSEHLACVHDEQMLTMIRDALGPDLERLQGPLLLLISHGRIEQLMDLVEDERSARERRIGNR